MIDTPASSSESAAASGKASPRPKRGCRGCLGKALLLLLILAIPAAFWLNGPGFRFLADWGLGKGLAAANLSAEYEVSGTLTSGIEIHNLSAHLLPVQAGEDAPAGATPIEALKVGTIEVRYDFVKLLQGDPFAALHKAKLKDVEAIIALSSSTPPDEEPEDETESGPSDADPLAIMWKLLGGSYDLENLNLVILQDGVENLRIEGLFLNLSSASDGNSAGELGFTHFKLGEIIEQGATRSPLHSTRDTLAIGRFEPIEGIAISEMTLFRKGNVLLTVGLDAASGSLLGHYRRDGTIAVELREGSVNVGTLAERFGFDQALHSGSVDALDLQFAGNPAEPATWDTQIRVAVSDVTFPGEGIDTATLEVSAANGQLELTLDAERKGAVAHAEATAAIGEAADAAALADVPIAIDLTLEVAAVDKFIPAEGPKITGALSLTAGAQLAARQLSDVRANLTTQSISYEGVVFDSLQLIAASKSDQLEITIDAASKGAVAHAQATATTGETFDPAALADVPVSIDLTVEVEAIEKLLPANSPQVTGALSLTADAQLAARQFSDINANLTTQSITYEGVDIDSLELKLTSPTAENAVGELDLALDGDTAFHANGTVGLKEFDYRAEATGSVLANQRLAKLLGSFGFDKGLEGKVDLNWNGEGILKPAEGDPASHQGQATVKALDLRIAEGRMINSAAISATYAPGSIDIESLEVLSGDLAISAAGSYQENLIQVSSLAIRQADQPLATGSLEVPFDRATFADKGAIGFFDQDQPLKVDFQSESLQIADLVALAGTESPVFGTIDASIAIDGTPRQLAGGGSVRATGLILPSAEDVPPGDLAVDFSIGDERVSVAGTLDHPQIETLSIDASIPFTPTSWLAGDSAPLEEPLQAKVNLPPSSLEFVSGYVPAIESITGSATIDVDIAGTIGRPTATGLAEISIAGLELKGSSAPSIRDAAIKLRVEDRVLFIDQFEALISGGRIALGGQVSLPADGSGPLLDLKADATDALIVRNPDLSIRADAELTLIGPWSKAALAGEIGLSDSRFVKDVDILPLSMPSREDSNLPEIESRATARIPPDLDLGLKIEPFMNWDLDVKLVTHDPFLVRSNLARIDVTSDIRVTGTLAKPVPDGRIQVTEGQLMLPFSRVNIEETSVEFGDGSGFNGKLNVKALAKVRSYEVYIYAFGPLLSPQHVLTSDPPLANEDIISLLATGTTREELAGGSGAVVASKAAQLFLQKLKQDNVDPDKEPGLLQELNDRTVLDIGSTDPRTGEQTIAGTIRLFRKFYLIANVGQESDYRVLFKYIFKFR